ncbi:MAG: YlzJ-like family protein [Bacillota bacterium]
MFQNEFIFADWEEFEPEYETITLGSNLKLLVERIDNKADMRVVRVLSTNPRDFLNSRYQPGFVLKYSLQPPVK